VISFTEALWAEYKNRGIRIFCLCPGHTKTGFHEAAGIRERKVFFPATSEEVVRFGLRIFQETNRLTAIYGFANRILNLGTRLLPRSWIALIARQIYRTR
jgi:short-subunit dehydrogenase